MNIIERYKKELLEICSTHRVLFIEEVLNGGKKQYTQKAKAACYVFLRSKGFTYVSIGKAFGKHHTVILYSIKVHGVYGKVTKD